MAADFDLSASFIPSIYRPPALLPIAKHRESLLYVIESFPVTIVVGQTGSGKTTQIPQFLDQAGWCEDGKVIAVTQVGELNPKVGQLSFLVLMSMSAAAKGGCNDCRYKSSRGNEMQPG